MTVPRQQKTGQAKRGEPDITYLEPVLWRHLTEAETDQGFCLNWLKLQCRMINEVKCGVVLLSSEKGGNYIPVASWPESFHSHQQFTEIIEKVIRDRKGFVLRSDEKAESENIEEVPIHLSYPIQLGEQLAGIVALAIKPRPSAELQWAMRQLQWGIAWIKNWLLQKQYEPDAVIRQRLVTVFDIVALALQEETFKSASSKIVTDLASRMNCDRVSIGFLKDNQARVTALSHSAKFDQQTNLMRSIGNAMDECLDQHESLVSPPLKDQDDFILRAHEELGRLHGSGSICTVPFLNKDGHGYGALTFERSADQPFTSENLELFEALVAIIGPVLEEKRKNEMPLLLKIKESFKNQLESIFGPGHLLVKFSVCCLTLLVVFFSFAKGDYRISARTSLEGTIQRAVIAPFDGFLFDARQRAGDVVNTGQILASLDTRDLKLEKLKLASEREQHILEYRKALAENEIALSIIIQEQIRQSESRLALLEKQIERAQVPAPFNGVIISGDLRQSIGAPVKQGEILFEIAPLNSYRVMLEIDEKDVEQLAVDQKGDMKLNSLPENIFPFIVDKLTPVSTTKEGRNFFIAEGHLLEISDRLRPGMQGYGKIYIDRRKLIWIWTHGLLDWLRLRLWNYLP